MGDGELVAFAEKKMAEIRPLLKSTDKARWLWGYYDAMADIVKKEGKNERDP